MSNASISAVVLAAGKGTRLNEGKPSGIPKVMHEIGGKPMLSYTLETLRLAGIGDIVIVVGYKAELVKERFGGGYTYALQEPQNGTGHAVQCAQSSVSKSAEHVLVIQGDDSAFYSVGSIRALLASHVQGGAAVSVLTFRHPNPGELGRIIRDGAGNVVAIREKEVLTDAEKRINEINTGTYCFRASWLWGNLPKLKPSATGKGELILPDLIEMAIEQGEKVTGHTIADPDEWIGVNTPEQLRHANEAMARRGT
ncbi:MAG: sugar phosphate nucleotidyltransferase [Patescibacteria group bacterium]